MTRKHRKPKNTKNHKQQIELFSHNGDSMSNSGQISNYLQSYFKYSAWRFQEMYQNQCILPNSVTGARITPARLYLLESAYCLLLACHTTPGNIQEVYRRFGIHLKYRLISCLTQKRIRQYISCTNEKLAKVKCTTQVCR